jgi:hypothetical protein
MAEVQIDTSGAVANVNGLTTAVETSTNAFGDLKKQMRDARNEMAAADEGSDAYLEASRKVGELKDKIADMSEEMSANAGNAFEALSNHASNLTSRLMNLDFEGATNSLKGMAGAVGKISFADITKGIGGMISALGQLAKAILTNPILLLATIIIAIIMNWDALVKLWNSGEIASLKAAEESLARQRDLVQQTVEIEQSRGKYSKVLYEEKQKILNLTAQELKLAQKRLELEGEEEEALKKKEEREKVLADIKKAQVEADGKIYQAYQGSIEYLDPAAALAQKKKDAATKELEAIELIKQRSSENNTLLEEANTKEWQFVRAQDESVKLRDRLQILVEQGVLTQEEANAKMMIAGNGVKSRQKVEQDILNIAKAKVSQMQWEKQNLASINQQFKDQLSTIQQVADAKMNAVKSDEEIAKEKEAEEKKQQAIAEAKRKAEERRAKAEAERKRIVEETAKIEEQMAEFSRRNQTEQEKELFNLQKKYEADRKILEQSKEGLKLLAQLDANYELAKAEVEQKYRDQKYLKDKELADKEYELQEAQYKELTRLQNTELENQIQDLVVSYDEKFAMAQNNAELELALKKELDSKIDALIADDNLKKLEKQTELNDLLFSLNATEKEKEIKALEDDYKKRFELAKGNADATKLLEQELAEERQRINLRYHAANLDLATGAMGALMALNDAFPANTKKNAEKSFKINKALQLASATMSAASAVLTVMADPTLIGPARWIAVATAGITGMANIIKISKTRFDASSFDKPTTPTAQSGSGAGANGGGNTPQAPAFDTSFLQNDNTMPAVQAYVVSTNVTSQQEADALIQNQTRL